ncbi:MAG: DUF1987 domain-containing protein [Magnetococcus sp. YQC-3]
MENLQIESTKSSPRILFDAASHVLEMTGESFPEDAALFYMPIFKWLHLYLEGLGDEQVQVKVDINYFNSSSSKVLMDLFELLDEYVQKGKRIEVFWISHAENDTGIEFGEEFKECVAELPFHLVTRA